MARKGLGKGLDSLIPDFYNEDFDSNSTQSLEDILNDSTDEKETEEEIEVQKEEPEPVDEVQEDDIDDKESIKSGNEKKVEEEGAEVDDSSSEDLSGNQDSEESVRTSQEVQIQQEHVDEVIEIVNKNPRITLWSSRSSAVFRYLRKTEPEFSISKEASVLIEEAVAKKYPEIWALFEDL